MGEYKHVVYYGFSERGGFKSCFNESLITKLCYLSPMISSHKKQAIVIISILIAAGCSHKPQNIVTHPAPPIIPQKPVRAGFETVHTSSVDSNVIIPDREQQVLTVNPRPTVIHNKKMKPERAMLPVTHVQGKPVQAKASTPQVAIPLKIKPELLIKPSDVWAKLCAGKILNKKERDVLKKHPLPQSWDDKKCAPVWNGEK